MPAAPSDAAQPHAPSDSYNDCFLPSAIYPFAVMSHPPLMII